MNNNNSIGNSSHGGTGNSSSRLSAAASSNVLTGIAAFRGQMFLIFTQLERATERKWFLARHLLEFLQLAGLVANAHFRWGSFLEKDLAYPLYGTNLPFFDESWTGTDLSMVAHIVPWVALVVTAFPLLCLGVAFWTDSQHLKATVNAVVSTILHAVSSWLFLPIAHSFASFFVCDRLAPRMYWFPDRECGGAVHGVWFTLGVVGLLVLLANSYIGNSLVFEDTWTSGRWSARSRPYLSEATTIAKLAIVVCYHVLLSKGQPLAFAITTMILMLGLAMFAAFSQPYFVPRVNSFICALHTASALIFAAAIVGLESTLKEGGELIAVFFCFPLGGAVAGALLPMIRRNSDLQEALRVVEHGGQVQYPGYDFPHGLPACDLAFTPHKALESGILSEARSRTEERQAARARRNAGGGSRHSDSDSELADHDQEPAAITTAYVRRIWCAADVELASRVLREYEFRLGARPPELMVAFVSRLFTKGLLKYHSSALAVDFQNYLFTQAFQPRLALSENENIAALDPSVTSMFRAMKLQLRLKTVLNITDHTHARTVKSALRLHKEALGHMTHFWNKLLGEKVDVMQLASIANHITTRREKAQDQFRNSLRFATRGTLAKYARFLEQVMYDSQSAALLNQFVADQDAERKTVRKADNTSAQGSVALSDLATSVFTRIDASMMASSDQDRSANISRLSATMHLLMLFIGVVVGLFFVYEGVRYAMTMAAIDRLDAVTQCRALVAHGAFVAEELSVTVQRISEAQHAAAGMPTTARAAAIASGATLAALYSRVGQLRAELKTAGSQFSALHNDLTLGHLKSDYGPLVDFLRGPWVEVVEDATTAQRSVSDLWSLGGRIGSAMTAVADAAIVNTSTVVRSVTFLRTNALDQLAYAYNTTVQLHRRETASWKDAFFWIVIGLVVLAFMGLFAVYCALVLNFATIGAAKLSIIGLFVLIPRVHLEALHSQAKERITMFDVEDTAAEQPAAGDLGDSGIRTQFDLTGTTNSAATAAAATAATAAATHQAVVRKAVLRGSTIRTAAPMSSVLETTLRMWDRGGSLESTDDTRSATEKNVDADAIVDADAAEMVGIVGETENRRTRLSAAKNATMRTEAAVHTRALRMSMTLAVMSVTTLLLLATALGVVVEAVSAKSALMDWVANDRHVTTLESTLGSRMRNLAGLAQGFALTGHADLLEEFTRVHRDALSLRDEREHLSLYKDQQAARLLVARRQIEDDLFRRVYVAIVLAAAGYGTDRATVEGLIQNLHYNMTAVRAVQQSIFAEFVASGVTAASNTYPSQDDVLDATKPADQQMLIAQALVLDQLFDAHFTLLARNRGEYAAFADSEIAAGRDRVRRLYPATLALMAASLLALWGSLMPLIQGRGARGSAASSVAAVGAVMTVAILMLIANLVVLSYTIYLVEDAVDVHTSYMADINRRNASFASVDDISRYARSFAAFGVEEFFARYLDSSDAGIVRETLLESLEGPLMNRVGGADVEALSTAVTAALNSASKLVALTTIGIRVAASSFGFVGPNASASSPARFAVLRDVSYNRMTEDGEEHAEMAYDTAAEYTTPAGDDARTAASRKTLAAESIAGSRFVDLRWQATTLLSNVFDQTRVEVLRQLASVSAHLDTMSAAAQGLAGASAALLFFACMYTCFTAVQRSMTGRSTTLVGGVSAANLSEVDVMFASLRPRVLFSLITIAMAFCAVVAFSLYANAVGNDRFQYIDRGSSRSWNVARSALLMQEALRLDFGNAVDTGVAYPQQARARLKQIGRRLLDERRELYIDFGWHFYSGADALFGPSGAETTQRFMADCDIAAEEAKDTPNSFAMHPSRGLYATSWTAHAADALELEWSRSVIELGDTDPVTSASTDDAVLDAITRRDQLVDLEMATFRGMNNATVTLVQQQRNSALDNSAIHYALCGATMVLLFGLLMFVFRPMIDRLLSEDIGTRLLLRMIPGSVRAEVPAIQEYLEHGTVTQNEKLQRISDVVSELSTVAYIVIDNVGTILRLSRAAADEFGYEADHVVGHNVKILMPHSIAKNHDYYLRRYRETGVKHVVDRTRRVKAQRKDGTTFPAELQVREFKRGARDAIFLGFVRDITTVIEYEKATKLNEAITDMSEHPVIVMDKIGVIHRVNRAAGAAFGFSEDELIGLNVKKLMPTAVADEHDMYLLRYQRTRVKTVVDSDRRVTAIRRNGAEFPAVITVREMCDDQGNTLYFIGYVRDLTDELLTKQGQTANRTVVENSPTPMVGITAQGTVTTFSPAAQRSWGYTEAEVIGQNVKMLMPIDVASKHDGYLSRYQKTGEKRMTDTVQEVKARRKDGTMFPCVANIKEIKHGDHVSFVGYMTDLTMHNKRIEATRISQQAMDASPVPIIITQTDGSIASFNTAAEKFFGYRVEEVVNKNVKLLMPSEVAELHDKYLERYRTTGVETIMNSKRSIVAQHKSGHRLECDLHLRETTVADVTHQSGKRTMYIGFIIETAVQRKLETANALNTAICDLCTVPMLSIDAEGEVLLYNRAAEKTFGYQPEEVLGKNIKMLMPKNIADQHDAFLQRYAETGVKHVVGRRKNGSEFPLELKIREVSKKGADPIFVGYARDLTEDLELQDLKDATDAVLDRCAAPVVAIDIKGTVLRFSAAAERLFRWQASEIIGKNVKVLMPREDAKKHDAYLAQYARTGIRRVTKARQLAALRHDGHVFPIELTLRETRTGTGSAADVAPLAFLQGALRSPARSPGGVSVASSKSAAVSPNAKPAPQSATPLATALLSGPVISLDSSDVVVPPDTLFVAYIRDLSMDHVLRRANEMRELVLDNATTPMFQIDTYGTIVYVNAAASREFGYELEQIMGKNIKMLMPDDVATLHDGYLARYRQTGEKHIIDAVRRLKGKRKNGDLFPIELSVREIEVDGAKRFVGYVRNVAEEMKTEDMRHLFRIISNLATVPIIALDQMGIIQFVNQAATDTFGYSQDELIGHNVKMLQPADVANVHDAFLEKYRRTRVKSIIGATRRILARRKNGKLFPAEISVQESQDRESGGLTWVGYIRDVSELVQAETTNKIAALTADLSPVPLITMNPRGTVLLFSRAAQAEFGYTASDVVGQNIKMLQDDATAAAHDEYLRRYAETGIQSVIGTARRVMAKRANGQLFPVELSIQEVKVEGIETMFVGFVRSLVDELQQKEAFESNLQTVNLLPIPFIAMSASGVIAKVNTAGLWQFGYEWAELQGRNIKMLMPDEYALNHDAYLERYQRTGVKKVVDSVKKVPGKRKDGTTFPGEITVKETKDELGNSIFFGFMRDTSAEELAAKEVQIGNAITSMSLVPLIVVDDRGTILKFSESAEATFMFKRTDVVGKNIKMLMPARVSAVHDSYLQRFRETGARKVIGTTRAVPAQRADGSEFVMQLRVTAVANADGTSTLVGYCDDISGQLRDEKEAAILHCINDLANTAVVVMNETGIVERVSRATCTTFGYTENEMIGHNVNMLMPRDIADVHDNYLLQYMRTKVKHVIDSTMRVTGKSADGKEFPIEIGVTELMQHGHVKYVGYIRDVTEDVAREQAMGFSNVIFSLSTTPVIITDSVGRIVKCSNAIESLFGYSADEITGRNLKVLMTAEIAAQHDGFLQRYALTGVKTVIDNTRSVMGRHKTGNAVPVRLSVREIKSNNETYFAGILEPDDKALEPVEQEPARRQSVNPQARGDGGHPSEAAPAERITRPL
jgi:PAS domain S-box-containing protein